MSVAIIVYPGSNRENDMVKAINKAGIKKCDLLYSQNNDCLNKYDAIILPGGFSYGDYLRAGAIAARVNNINQIISYAKKGGKILGVCNGFQILCEANLLKGTLLDNINGRFICSATTIVQEQTHCIWTKHYCNQQKIILPIAHHTGRFYANKKMLEVLKSEGNIVWRYGLNPNGSIDSIAGITDNSGRILGVMPHPENSLTNGLENYGVKLFQSLLN